MNKPQGQDTFKADIFVPANRWNSPERDAAERERLWPRTWQMVCVEADAGWAPHFMYRMDHAYERHRFWQKCEPLSKLPSEFFRENIYLTFQDDYTAFRNVDQMNPRRLMWASDFPHSDSTWPWSQDVLAEQTANLTEEQKRWILRDNVRELYNLA